MKFIIILGTLLATSLINILIIVNFSYIGAAVAMILWIFVGTFLSFLDPPRYK